MAKAFSSVSLRFLTWTPSQPKLAKARTTVFSNISQPKLRKSKSTVGSSPPQGKLLKAKSAVSLSLNDKVFGAWDGLDESRNRCGVFG